MRLDLYGAGGARIRRLARGARPPGRHELIWDGRDERGPLVPPGAYFARLDAEGRTLRRIVMVVR